MSSAEVGEDAVEGLARSLYGATLEERIFPWGSLSEPSQDRWREAARTVLKGRSIACGPTLVDRIALHEELVEARELLAKVAKHLRTSHVLYDVHVLGHEVRAYAEKHRKKDAP